VLPQSAIPNPKSKFAAMLSTSLVQEIAHLLELGELSHRQIAARLSVSRSTISAIASGRRGLYGKEPNKPDTPITPTTPPTRCPRCGYRVYLPCIICRIRELRTRQLFIQKLAAQSPNPETSAKVVALRPRDKAVSDCSCQLNLASRQRVG
jgi:hypothetical protein